MEKHAKPEEIVATLRQFEVLTAQGKSIVEALGFGEACRS